jgi:hypothetical protein
MPSVILLAALVLQQQSLPPARSTARTPTPEAVAADTGSLRHANGRVPPIGNAIRATAGSPRIDGRLDDAVWSLARPLAGFTQRQPLDGQPATESTVVRIAYDDEAIYIGARMYDSEPARIAAQLGRRDNISQSDLFEVDFDSYHDHQTSFQFFTNPLGVKRDLVASTDFAFGDLGWDPVWDAATQRDSLGWTAEFRIPLSQLRFPNAPTQVWGINFYRYVHRKAEETWWSYVPQTDNGYASIFGHVFGLENLPQPRRLEVLPYLTGAEERLSSGSAGNPFNDGSREVGRFGLDLKYGLTSNLTLNASVNPDFGQVDADPAEVNLTAYETYLSERRPFFVEGGDIFRATSPGNIQVNGPQFLYSRRIGRSPQGSADFRGESSFTDEPTSTTILGATKLSGRTAGGWSVGLLEAVTAREYATVQDSLGNRFRDQVEPLTNYTVVRAKRDFGNGASTFGITGTAVNRRLDGSRLDFLRSAAYAGGLDFGHRFNRNRYSMFAALGYSLIQGDTQAIQSAQRSSARYYQRPDADYVEYDPTRTSLAGWRAALGFAKDEGSTNWSVGGEASSPGFEINDLGYQTRADRASLYLSGSRRWTRPGRVFRFAQLYARSNAGWNFGGDRTSMSANLSAYAQFLNYWGVNAYVSRSLRAVNDGLLRGGPAGITPAGWFADVGGSSDGRKPLRFYFDVGFGGNDLGYKELGIYTQVMYRPTSTVSLTVSPGFSSSRTPQQYVTSRADSTATATLGRRYLFAEIFQRSLDLTTRLDVTISPVLSLQLFAQPFVATGDYRRFKELTAPRTTNYATYGETPGSSITPVTNTTDGVVSVVGYDLDPDGAGPRPSVSVGNPDFSYRSLRGNAVLRYEYRPGSTVYLVWTQSCSSYGANPAFNAAQDFRQLCQGRSDNVFAVKVNYWLSL